jgi:hypothetical protein
MKATKAIKCQKVKLGISRTSSRRSIDSGPFGEGQYRSCDPPAQARNEDEERERWIEADTLEDLPARKDGDQRSNDVIEQAVIFQFLPPWAALRGKPNERGSLAQAGRP